VTHLSVNRSIIIEGTMSQRLSHALRTVSFNQTMIRVKDPKKSVGFYEKHFNMTLAHSAHFSDFSLYFMISLPTSSLAEEKKTIDYIWSGEYGCTLELTHNHGTENDPAFHYHPGNTNPLGFGHLGFMLPQGKLGELQSALEKSGHSTTLGKSSVLTTHDPDGYEVQVAERSDAQVNSPSWHRSMIRVKNAVESASFYQNICGMSLLDIQRNDQEGWTSYFFGTCAKASPDPKSEASHEALRNELGTVLELREYDNTPEGFKGYHNGNVEPRGFGHLALLVDDVYETCSAMEELGVKFQKKPDDGRMKGLAFILDPDGYEMSLRNKYSLSLDYSDLIMALFVNVDIGSKLFAAAEPS
jgi:lactoylglutathione lyase